MVDIRKIRKRSRIILAFIILIGAVFGLRAAQVQILQHGKYAAYADSQQRSAMTLKAKRGSIYDIQGRLLAYDVEVKTYTVNPRYMKDKSSEAGKLAKLTGKSVSYWMRKFKDHPGYLVAASRAPQNKESQFEKSKIETLRYRAETERVYPYNGLAAEVIGRTDTDNKGVSGLEKYYDDILSGADGSSVYLRDARGTEVTSWEHTIIEPINGNDLYLALDIDFQQIVADELTVMLDSSRALWGTAVFLDVETGGVLACATVEREALKFPRCRSIVDMNEPGSTAKIMPLVTVFRTGLFEPDDVINVEGGRFNIGRRVIRDDHPYDYLRCDEIGVYSSNIGVSKMGLKAGSELIYKTLMQFGFGAKTGIDFPGEVTGDLCKPDSWNDHLLANICFGYGMTVSGVQMAAAYGIIAGGGELKKPYFASKMISPNGDIGILNAKRVVRKALEYDTIEIIHGILLDVVRKGTAQKAGEEYSLVAGKTGTALRVKKEGRGYDASRSLASFAGYFPAAAPRVVGIVMFDEPKSSIYGGDVCAPVFKKVAIRYSSLPRNYVMLSSAPPRPDTADPKEAGDNEQADILAMADEIQEDVVVEETTDDSILPDFKGQTIRDAMREARRLGLNCQVVGSGVVREQEPSPGAAISKGANLLLTGDL